MSNQGRQRGRAKGLIRRKNLNRGQQLGYGPKKVVFAGLTESINLRADKSKRPVEKMTAAQYEAYNAQLEEMKKRAAGKGFGRSKALTPLMRGWTGPSEQGKIFGPPSSRNPACEKNKIPWPVLWSPKFKSI